MAIHEIKNKKLLDEIERRRNKKHSFYKAVLVINILIFITTLIYALISFARVLVPKFYYSNNKETIFYMTFALINLINQIAIVYFWYGVKNSNDNQITIYIILNFLWVFLTLLDGTFVYGIPGMNISFFDCLLIDDF